MDFRDLFKPKKTDIEVVATPMTTSSDARREGETYIQWGVRVCGIVSGSENALPPYLHKVYNGMYNEQANNVELQEAARKNTQADIDQRNEEIDNLKKKVVLSEENINDTKQKIQDLKDEKQRISIEKGRVNKDQKLKLIIGLIIIIPLTFYLFLFYSSTFYSAFFRNPEKMLGVVNSMFDSNALASALNDGFAELCFVLSAPIIFLGLGFCLHFFSVQKERTRFVKMGALLLVTVMFDSILAFLIGDQIHTYKQLIGLIPIGQKYTVDMAIHDETTWGVIFCGFIVYVIWGVIFDMCMSAYDKLDLNKTRLENIAKEILMLEDAKKALQTEKEDLEKLILETKKQVNVLMAKLGHETYIDYHAIKAEMNNFFAGWIKQMTVLEIDKEEQSKARLIFENEINNLIKQ